MVLHWIQELSEYFFRTAEPQNLLTFPFVKTLWYSIHGSGIKHCTIFLLSVVSHLKYSFLFTSKFSNSNLFPTTPRRWADPPPGLVPLVLQWTQSCLLNFPLQFYGLSLAVNSSHYSPTLDSIWTHFFQLFFIIHQQEVPQFLPFLKKRTALVGPHQKVLIIPYMCDHTKSDNFHEVRPRYWRRIFSHSHQFKYLGNVFAPFTMQKQHIYAGKSLHA